MTESKHIGLAVVILTALALAALILAGAMVSGTDSGVTMAYEDGLFDTDEIISVDIIIDADDWSELIANAAAETYYACDIKINGATYSNVGIRAKGNTSLTSVQSMGSDRYSFKIQFDEYVAGQTCLGLDKLVLNNNYADATMMKEALTYDMFAFLGADASLYNYAAVYVNGEYWGVYLALEPVEESFALRNYGVCYGEFYKPDSMNFGGAGKMQDFDIEDVREAFGFGVTDDTTADSDTRRQKNRYVRYRRVRRQLVRAERYARYEQYAGHGQCARHEQYAGHGQYAQYGQYARRGKYARYGRRTVRLFHELGRNVAQLYRRRA